MSDYLCIALQAISEEEGIPSLDWCLFDAAAQCLGRGHAPLDEIPQQLPEDQEDCKVIAIIPANRTLLTTVDVPEKQIRHLKNALPYMVEEQLIDPIEEMHLATPALTKGGHVPLAAIRKDEMAHWIALLEEQGMAPDFMFLDVLCVPHQEHHWSILFHDDYALLRQGEHDGVSLPAAALESSIQLAVTDLLSQEDAELPEINFILPATSEDSGNEAIKETNDQALAAKLEQFVRSENLVTRQQHYEETGVEILSVTAIKHLHSGLNLMQGSFRSSNASTSSAQGVKKLFAGLAATVAAFALINLAGGLYFNHQAKALSADNISMYREVFPKQRRITDPRKELNSKLSRAGGSGGSRFLSLLDASSAQLPALGNSNAVKLKQLRYDNQRSHVMLELEVADIQALDNYKQALTGQGLTVEILSANKSENSVNGRIQIGEQ